MRPDRLFLDGLCSHDVDDETCDQTTQIEAAVEPVGEASKVVLGVLAVVQGMEGSGQRGLECGAIKPTSSAQGTTRFISSRNSRLRVLLVLRSNPVVLRLICFMLSLSHIQGCMRRFCRPSLAVQSRVIIFPVEAGHCSEPGM